MTATNVLDEFRRAMTARFMRHHVGRVMFCPLCGDVLDCRRAVELDVIQEVGNECASSRVLCAACFDKMDIERMCADVADVGREHGLPLRLEVHDGREYERDGTWEQEEWLPL